MINALIGLVLRYPLVTGLLAFSFIGICWSYYEGGARVHKAVERAVAEAKIKDAKENAKLETTGLQIIHEIEKAEQLAETQKEKYLAKIKGLPAHQCLDLKLRDLGL